MNDTKPQIAGFYMEKYYALDNFSAFSIRGYWGIPQFMTAEHAYQWSKFSFTETEWGELGSDAREKILDIREAIVEASSAHEAKQIGGDNKSLRHPDFDSRKVALMKGILEVKFDQHPYVQKTVERSAGLRIVETSHIDPFWGSGPDGNGLSTLGNLWMEIRLERLGIPIV